MSDEKQTGFLLIHGSWHGAWCWQPVQQRLASSGYPSLAIDLPGHGLNTALPDTFNNRPLDPEAFATEPSPLASTTIAEFAGAVIAGAEQLKATGVGRVIAVGHSMGGVPLTFAAARRPELFAELVYLAALAPTPDKPAGAYLELEDQHSNSKIGSVIMADPAVVGALRIDPRSNDPDYQANYAAAMAADLDPDQAPAVMHLLTPDAPVSIYGEVAEFDERFADIERTYVICADDACVMPSTSRAIINDMNAAWPSSPTSTVEIAGSHSTLLSKPDEIATVFVWVAKQGT
jgi:pimeloyl-ACP methyl ester carboxylesterase